MIYRAFLLYIKWDDQGLTLQKQSAIIHKVLNSKSNAITIDAVSNDEKQDPHKIMKYMVISTLIIGLILLCITLPAVLDVAFESLSKLMTIPYLMVIILGAIVLFKGRKMKESLLCKRETYVISILIVVISALQALPVPKWRMLICIILCM